MLIVWIALGILVLSTATGALLAMRAALSLFRQLRSTREAVLAALGRLEKRIVHLSEVMGGGLGPHAELNDALTSLRESKRRLTVLVSAVQRVRNMVGEVTAVYPRKA